MIQRKPDKIPPLSVGARWLLTTYAAANTANALASVFVNLFVFVVSGQLAALALFNGAYFFSLTFVFYATAGLLRGKTPLFAYRLGLLLTIGFYATLLGLLHSASHYILWLGLYYGISQGVYWFGVNLMTFDTVPTHDRIRFYGINSAISSFTGIAAPLAGGAIISTIPHLLGYITLFAVALIVYASALVLSLSVVPGPAFEKIPLKDSFRLSSINPLWRKAMVTIVIRGTREGITGLGGIFLVYSAIHAAWAVGLYAAITAIFRMGSSLIVARWVTPRRRVRALWIGTLGMTASALVLFIQPTWPVVFLYGVFTAVAMPWYTIPNEAVPLDVMDSDKGIVTRRVNYTLSRELGLNMGRLFSLGILASIYQGSAARDVLLILLVLTSLAQGLVAQMAKGIWQQLKLLAA